MHVLLPLEHQALTNMSLYKNKATQEVRDLSDAQIASWTAANNPKLNNWEPYTPPDPVDPPVYVPQEVGPFQIRGAMILSGYAADEPALDTLIYGAIDAAVVDAQQNAFAKLAWRRASTFKRSNPFLQIVKAVLNKTDEDIDNLFILADTL